MGESSQNSSKSWWFLNESQINVKAIIAEYLDEHGYDGLCNGDCCCDRENMLKPCVDCRPGYLMECEECPITPEDPRCITLVPGVKPCENNFFKGISDDDSPDLYEKLNRAISNLPDPSKAIEALEICKEYGSVDAYIDTFCFMKPKFQDGEVADFGDEIDPLSGDHDDVIRSFTYIDHTPFLVLNGEDGIEDGYWCPPGHELERPKEIDTLEKVDDDCSLTPSEYVKKFDIAIEDPEITETEAMIRHIVKRRLALGR